MNHLIKTVFVLQKLHHSNSINAINNVSILKLCSSVPDYRLLTVLYLLLPFSFFKKYLASSRILLCDMHYLVGGQKQPPCAPTGPVSRLAKKDVVYHVL